MNESLSLFPHGLPTEDIRHDGLVYRPYRKGMEAGFDKVKSGEVRPHGWGMYLFKGGYIVIKDSIPVDSVPALPPEVKRALDAERPAP